jgi:hypothetical protein
MSSTAVHYRSSCIFGSHGLLLQVCAKLWIDCQPIDRTTKKGESPLDPQVGAAFEELKRAMVTTHVLALPDFTTVFIVETDASNFDI